MEVFYEDKESAKFDTYAKYVVNNAINYYNQCS